MQNQKYKVLLLGSGMMTATLIEYLIKFGDTHVTVASNLLNEAQKLAQRFGSNVSACFLDIKNIPSLESLISEHCHVISFIPPWMHTPICHACLRLGKNMTTSSYISPDMVKMN
jgi:alpha-aminoadipic semialdehyde synthase